MQLLMLAHGKASKPVTSAFQLYLTPENQPLTQATKSNLAAVLEKTVFANEQRCIKSKTCWIAGACFPVRCLMKSYEII